MFTGTTLYWERRASTRCDNSDGHVWREDRTQLVLQDVFIIEQQPSVWLYGHCRMR